MENPRLVLTAKEAAEAMNVSMPTMYQWMRTEGFPAFKTGKKWLVPARSFEQWIEKQASCGNDDSIGA